MMAAMGRRFLLCGVLLMCLLSSSPVFGQRRSRADIKITEIKADAVKTPDFKSAERSVKDHWGRFTVKFDVKRSGGKGEWINEIEITWKVLVTTNEGRAWLMSKTVAYDDIEEGSGHYACIYLKPKFMKRYMNSNRFNVAAYSLYAEIRIDGQKVDSFLQTKPKHSSLGRWYREDANKERSDRYLIAKSRSPFATMDYDYYETESTAD